MKPPLTRRSFLTRSATLAAAAVTLPEFTLAPSAKAATRLPVVGTGAHTYECVHDWLLPPEGMVWGETHGLAQDAAGFIYVAHTVNRASMRPETVVVYDSKGNYVRAFGAEFRGGAHGLDLRREGSTDYLYHCDTNRCMIVKTTLTGEVVWSHGYPRQDPAYAAKPIPFVPTNVAFAPNGDFFVGDGYGSHRVLKFSAQGEFQGEIGQPAPPVPAGQSAPAELPPVAFREPHGLCVDTRGSTPVLVVGDRRNNRLQTFSLDGTLLRTVSDPTRLRLPCDFNTRGDWMVCPDLDSQVCILDRDYQVVAQLGDGQANNGRVGSRRSQPRSAFTPGEFITPHDAIFLADGNILVAEYLPIGRITLLRRTS